MTKRLRKLDLPHMINAAIWFIIFTFNRLLARYFVMHRQHTDGFVFDLVRLIWKCKYFYHVHNIMIMENYQYSALLVELQRLEREHPNLIRTWSPSGVSGFNEAYAILAYGPSWDNLKRTWDLVIPEMEGQHNSIEQ